MKRNGSVRGLKVSEDGQGVVSHAGLGMLRELTEDTDLVAALNAALADTYRGPWVHAPGGVLSDLAVAVADGADAITGIAVLGDREKAFGAVASMPTAWRALDRIDEGHLSGGARGSGRCSVLQSFVWRSSPPSGRRGLHGRCRRRRWRRRAGARG